MRHQNTCQNLSSKYQKKFNFEFPLIKTNKPKKSNLKRTTSLTNKNQSNDNKCPEHHLNFINYCLNCKEDTCSKCLNNNHLLHDVIKYEEISLNEKQIEFFKEKYEKYINKYNELMNKIKEWQKILNKNIKDFEEYMQINIINIIKKMIEEYRNDNLNYNKIIEYRIVYSLLIENNEDKLNNQKIIKLMKTYRSLKNYEDYKFINENENLSTISLDNIINYNDLINKGNFEKKGNNIIKFLFSNYSLYYNKNVEDNIIKKLIEIKQKKNNDITKIKKANKSSTNIFKNTSDNFKNILFNKDNNIYEKKKAFNKKRNINVKEQQKFDDDIKDNININSIINEKNNNINKKEKEFNSIWKNKNFFNKEEFQDNYDDFDDLEINLDFNIENNHIGNKRAIIFNNNINNFNNINNINNKNNNINNYNIEKVYSDRSHKSRVFIHKKFNSTLSGLRSYKDINTLNQSQSDNGNDQKKEGAYNTIDFNNYNFENIINNNYNNNNTLSNRIFPENEKMNIK